MRRKNTEGTYWHVVIDDDRKVQEIVAPFLEYDNYELIAALLEANAIRRQLINYENKSYLIYYDENAADKIREFMIWKYEMLEDETIKILDVDMSDCRFLSAFIESEWIK